VTVALPGTRRVEHVMGIPVVVDIRDEGDHDDALATMFAWLRFVDETFSTYRPDSEISRLDRGELALEDAHPDVRWILARCDELRAATDGYFDARAAGRGLDPSGLVKGWSIERAAGILEEAGLRNFAVNAGGDIALRGGALPDDVWRVGIQHPLVRDRIAETVELTDGAVATSGEYERGRHVFDPHTAEPPDGLLSVTITGADLAVADAYATAAFARGATRAPHFTARLGGYEAMTILADETVLFTPRFPRA
jgi:thiamine biosynthesis lipoprotein